MRGGEAAPAEVAPAEVAPVDLAGGKRHRRRSMRGGETEAAVDLSAGGRHHRMYGGEDATIEGGKRCSKGYHRSRSGTCSKHSRTNSKGQYIRRSPNVSKYKPCPSGQTRNAKTSRCHNVGKYKACASGKTRNPKTNRCHTPKA